MFCQSFETLALCIVKGGSPSIVFPDKINRSHYEFLAWNSLCRSRWPLSHRFAYLTSQVLGLKASSTVWNKCCHLLSFFLMSCISREKAHNSIDRQFMDAGRPTVTVTSTDPNDIRRRCSCEFYSSCNLHAMALFRPVLWVSWDCHGLPVGITEAPFALLLSVSHQRFWSSGSYEMALQIYFLGLGHFLCESLVLLFHSFLWLMSWKDSHCQSVCYGFLLLLSGDMNRGENKRCCDAWENNRAEWDRLLSGF